MEDIGIVRNEVAADRHQQAWDSLIGVDAQKERARAWAALTLRAATLDRTATAVNRLALVEGPPGTGKTTLARSLAAPLSALVQAPVRLIEFAAHDAMSGEHGQTQRQVHAVLTETVPALAGTGFAVLVIDEVDALVMHRGQVSLDTNPVDVHRTTDAAITALDILADACPNVVTVATTNFPGLIDAALRSRADIAITIPLPAAEAVEEIVRAPLLAWAREFPALKALAEDSSIADVATELAAADIDARQARKFVLDVLSSDLSLASDPGRLTATHLRDAARDHRRAQ